jgi:hypothetical protein
MGAPVLKALKVAPVAVVGTLRATGRGHALYIPPHISMSVTLNPLRYCDGVHSIMLQQLHWPLGGGGKTILDPFTFSRTIIVDDRFAPYTPDFKFWNITSGDATEEDPPPPPDPPLDDLPEGMELNDSGTVSGMVTEQYDFGIPPAQKPFGFRVKAEQTISREIVRENLTVNLQPAIRFKADPPPEPSGVHYVGTRTAQDIVLDYDTYSPAPTPFAFWIPAQPGKAFAGGFHLWHNGTEWRMAAMEEYDYGWGVFGAGRSDYYGDWTVILRAYRITGAIGFDPRMCDAESQLPGDPDDGPGVGSLYATISIL